MHKDSSACAVCRPRPALEVNGNWKGGRTRNKAGYVMVRVPEHPRASANGGYVFEHIVVMEDIIGRLLVPDETVHHRNGMKSDNRPVNLELWTSNHPTGLRSRDAVAWATEILARYGGWDLFGEPL